MENIGLQGSLDSAQRLRAVVLEEGITDLLRNPRRRVLVITPSGKVINGVVLNLQYEQSSESLTTGDMVAGLRSADLTIGLEP